MDFSKSRTLVKIKPILDFCILYMHFTWTDIEKYKINKTFKGFASKPQFYRYKSALVDSLEIPVSTNITKSQAKKIIKATGFNYLKIKTRRYKKLSRLKVSLKEDSFYRYSFFDDRETEFFEGQEDLYEPDEDLPKLFNNVSNSALLVFANDTTDKPVLEVVDRGEHSNHLQVSVSESLYKKSFSQEKDKINKLIERASENVNDSKINSIYNNIEEKLLISIYDNLEDSKIKSTSNSVKNLQMSYDIKLLELFNKARKIRTPRDSMSDDDDPIKQLMKTMKNLE